jgi:hypothetical protein
MTVKYSWSYSSLDLYKQCPHKYYRLRIKKDIVEPPTEHLSYGLEVHKAAEEYIRDGKDIPEKYAFIKESLDMLNAIKGEKHCELRLGLTKGLEPCTFFAKDVWWRGIADLIILQGEKAYVVDYKTGKSAKYADPKQLELLSLALFKHFPQVKKVKGGLLFVVANEFVKADYEQEKEGLYWTRWIEDTNRLEKSIELDVWNPKPNFSCTKWCAVKDCVHNGKGSYR